jgi:hypothetical protein
LRRGILVPNVKRVGSGRDVADGDVPSLIRHAKVRRVHGKDDRFHLRVNIAEHVRSARTVEPHRLLHAGPTGTEIESRTGG